MAMDLKIGDTIEANIPDWMALAEGLRDEYNLPVTRVTGRVTHVSAKAIFLDLTEGPVKKRIFLALSLINSKKITVGILNSADIDAEPVEFSGTIAKVEKPFPDGRIYLSADSKFLLAETPFEHADRCRQVLGGRWDYDARAWRYPANPLTALALADAFQGTKVNQTDVGYQSLITLGKQMDSFSDIKLAGEDELAQPEGLKSKLWIHQLRALYFASALGSAAFFMAMGTGKTLSVIAFIVHNNIKRALVVAPKSVVAAWPNDVRKHVGEDKFIVCALDEGSVAKKVKLAEAALAEGDRTGKRVIIVVNYESAWRFPFGMQIGDDNRIKENGFVFKNSFDLLVLDESHKIKNAQGRTAKFCHRIAKRVPHKLLLTGTPMPHDPLDIFSQYLVLDGGATFGTSFSKFRAQYARMGGYGGHEILGYRNISELQEKMYRSAFRVTEDAVELPERVFLERFGTLSAAERKAYDDMETLMMAEIDELIGSGQIKDAAASEMTMAQVEEDAESYFPALETWERYDGNTKVIAQNVLAKILKLAQLSSGFIINEDGAVAEFGTSKLDLLMETLEDIDRAEPFVVFVRFKHDIDAISARLKEAGYKAAELSGRRNQLKEWQAGQYQALIVQLQSGGVGVDFTRSGEMPCKYCIYYGKDYNWGNYVQSLKRIHRPGQTETVRFITLMMEDTVDETVEEVLVNRGDLVESVLAARNLRKVAEFISPQGADIDLMTDALNDAVNIAFGA